MYAMKKNILYFNHTPIAELPDNFGINEEHAIIINDYWKHVNKSILPLTADKVNELLGIKE